MDSACQIDVLKHAAEENQDHPALDHGPQEDF